MSATLESVKTYLPKYRLSRMGLCGAPMPTMRQSDGSTIEGATFRCADRFCAYCDRCRAQRVYACIMRATSGVLGGEHAGVMVTLTHQKLPGLSRDALIASRELQQKIQSECHRRLRRHDYAVRESARQSAAGAHRKSYEWLEVARAMLPRFNPSSCYKEEDRTLLTNRWSGMNPASTDGTTTYIWAREVTSGGSERYEGWHVHAHYLVPCESDAHRLISAHLAACRALGVVADVAQQRISMPTRASWRGEGSADMRDAVGYITAYITKCDLPEKSSVIEAYIYGIKGMRQYDAAGKWRPIGVGKKRDEHAPRVVEVVERVRCVTVDGELVERSLTRSIEDFMRQKTPWWAQATGSVLDQYKTNFRNIQIPASMVERAEKYGVFWKSPQIAETNSAKIPDFEGLPDHFLTGWTEIV